MFILYWIQDIQNGVNGDYGLYVVNSVEEDL